ncbi:MAG: pilus assembly protein [Duganella sp.]
MNGRRTAGTVTAEFSLALLAFLTFSLGVLEVARALYVINMLPMITQRAAIAAANTNVRDAAALAAVRQQAMFRNGPGMLTMGTPISDAHVRIDYLALAGPAGAMMTPVAGSALPNCPANNRIACMKDLYGPECVRLVRVRICDPAATATCERVPFQSLLSFSRLPFRLPVAASIVSAESLGARPGDGPCP